jgi:hypothetical protein
MALKDLDDIKPIEHTGKKPKAKKKKEPKNPRTQRTRKSVLDRDAKKWRCEGCKGRLRGGHVVERSGKASAKPKIYCLDCR